MYFLVIFLPEGFEDLQGPDQAFIRLFVLSELDLKFGDVVELGAILKIRIAIFGAGNIGCPIEGRRSFLVMIGQFKKVSHVVQDIQIILVPGPNFFFHYLFEIFLIDFSRFGNLVGVINIKVGQCYFCQVGLRGLFSK